MVKTLSRLNSAGKTGLTTLRGSCWITLRFSDGKLNNPQVFAARLQGLMEKAAENL